MPNKLKKIITGGFEVVKDSAKQIADTVSPGALLDQALGKQVTRKDEFGEYLKNLSPNISSEELEKKRKELSLKDQKKLEEERKKLQLAAIPVHMRPAEKPQEPRPYELARNEEERKKAAAVEAQKKQSQFLLMPQGKQQRGSLFAKKKARTKGFEGLVKDTKVG